MSAETSGTIDFVKQAMKRIIPLATYRQPITGLRRLRIRHWRPATDNDLISTLIARLRRLRKKPVPANLLPAVVPVSKIWGLDRGTAIDRYYIEQFLSAHASDIRGRTLELGDRRYTRKFGDGVLHADVIHLESGNPEATIVGDLETGEGIPSDCYDCLIVINTFRLVYDVQSALANCYRALRAGGVLLGHFTGITSACPDDPAWKGDFWRFTSASARSLCAEVFPIANVEVEAYGNVRTATAYLYGLAAEELSHEEMNYRDPNYELAILVRAVKPG